MPAFAHFTVAELLDTSAETILHQLARGYALSGFVQQFTQQTLTWEHDLIRLRQVCEELVQRTPDALGWTFIFEYEIPRKPKRLDLVLLAGQTVFVLECKRGEVKSEADGQVEEYALLLHYFHAGSRNRLICPVVVSPDTDDRVQRRSAERRAQLELSFPSLSTYWIRPTAFASWDGLAATIGAITLHNPEQTPIDARAWLESAYSPVPTIIEAARQLRTGLHIREIAQCEASEHELQTISQRIESLIRQAEESRTHTLCFVTGVPGSGKTLVGLSIAHLADAGADAIHFMSGNGPLVKVLQENFRRQAQRDGVRAKEAEIQAKTLIENIHIFARTYTDDPQGRAPSNHVVIFDEAQRAWDRQQNESKFKRPYSEPEMLLQIMERHQDWAFILALVGGGQEINSGEAGLEEWGRAIESAKKAWRVVASPEVLSGGASTAGRKLFPSPSTAFNFQSEPLLHLRTSNRSLRAENLAQWVNAVLDNEPEHAQSLCITDKYPVFLTRSLQHTRRLLRQQSIGPARYGLVASSKAARLRAEGLETDSAFHAEYPWEHWYLSDRTDIRSSYQCEVFATEFEIQGLELDWVGLCWSGDYVYHEGWHARALHMTAPSRWRVVCDANRVLYRRNAYRVLLTRARQGMVLFVPTGDVTDSTRDPAELDSTAAYLQACGAHLLDAGS